jgi:hypothetical protein
MLRNVFICFLSLSLFTSEITCQSRNPSLILSSEQFNIAVNPYNGDYIVLVKDSFYLFNLSVSGDWRPYKYKKNDLDTVLNQPEELNFIHDTKKVLFFAGGGGQVYLFEDSSILRQDKSFLQKNQFGAASFEYKDKIILYSGYGFYSYKPYMTEFSDKTNEWFLRPYAANQYLPKGRQAVVYQVDKKRGYFYMSSGYTLNKPYFEDVENLDLNDVWRFDLNTNKWKQLGYIDDDRRIRNLRFPFFAGENFYAIEKGPTNAVVKINIAKNSFEKFKTDHLVDQSLVEYGTIYNTKDGNILLVIKGKDLRDNPAFIVSIVPLKELEKNLIISKKYYFTVFDKLWPFFLMIAGLVSLVFFNRAFKKRKNNQRNEKLVIHFNLTEKEVTFSGSRIPFEEEQIQFLNYLVENGGEISNNDLLDFIKKGQESLDTLKKRKLKLIMDINQIFKISTGLSNPFLLELKDNNDRRYKDYLINPIYEVRV